MTSGNDHRYDAQERVSAAFDGELDAQALQSVCAGWKDDPAARERWHCYRLIGDVLRSDELSSSASRDRAFLRTFQERLSAEPVVLAPAPLPGENHEEMSVAASAAGKRTGARRGRSWSATAAVAAGFMLVGGVLVTLQTTPSGVEAPLAAGPSVTASPSPPPSALAEASTVEPAAITAVAASAVAPEPVIVMDGEMLRDARLQRYLAAHKQFGGSSALGVPSGFLRSATLDHSKR
jgi:sigma-E factor negative regulatory protein RseA